MIPDLQTLTLPLKNFCQFLGISEQELAGAEEDVSFLLYRDVESDLALTLTLEQLNSLVHAYGSALDGSFLLGRRPVLSLTQNLGEEDLKRFREDLGIDSHEKFKIKLSLSINKSDLLRAWGDFTGCRVLLFLFPQALERQLTCTLPQLEKLLWPDKNEKAVVLVSERDIYLNGPFLSIFGGKLENGWLENACKKKVPDEWVQQVYNECQNLKWMYRWVLRLTPFHLIIKGKHNGEDTISRALSIHLINTIIMYTADITAGSSMEPLVATYSGDKGSVDLPLMKSENTKISREDVDPLVRVLRWTYNLKWVSDRLPLVQIEVIHALKESKIEDRLYLFLNPDFSGTILSDLRWEWKGFIENKLDEYMDGEKDLEDDLAKTIQEFSDQVSDMIKGLCDTVLAAVGVVLGTFIASLYENKFNPDLFKLGMVLYAVYVFIFPLLFNMINRWQSFLSLERGFKDRKKRFENRLSSKRVEAIVGERAKKAMDRFEIWFTIAAGTYLILIVLALIASVVAPIWIEKESLPGIWEMLSWGLYWLSRWLNLWF